MYLPTKVRHRFKIRKWIKSYSILSSAPSPEEGGTLASCSHKRRTRRACSSARSARCLRRRNKSTAPATWTGDGRSRRRDDVAASSPTSSDNSSEEEASSEILFRATVPEARSKHSFRGHRCDGEAVTAVRKLCVYPRRPRGGGVCKKKNDIKDHPKNKH